MGRPARLPQYIEARARPRAFAVFGFRLPRSRRNPVLKITRSDGTSWQAFKIPQRSISPPVHATRGRPHDRPFSHMELTRRRRFAAPLHHADIDERFISPRRCAPAHRIRRRARTSRAVRTSRTRASRGGPTGTGGRLNRQACGHRRAGRNRQACRHRQAGRNRQACRHRQAGRNRQTSPSSRRPRHGRGPVVGKLAGVERATAATHADPARRAPSRTPRNRGGRQRVANSAIRPRIPLRKRGLSSVDICLASSTASVIATGSSISGT